jgi:NADP-dependent 3-hydroxy acid dehydrogenase YdfG
MTNESTMTTELRPAGTAGPSAARATAAGPGPFTGRVAVVTGASSGIGRAIARRLAEGGARVAAVARRGDRLAELGPGVTAVPADVADPQAVAAAVARVVDELGPPDLVVAGAGVMLPNDVTEPRLDEWQRTISVNIAGVAAVVTATVGHLAAAAADGRPADLVLVSSIGDAISFPGYAFYGASKAAVTKLSHDLHLDLAPLGVRTMNVRPGLVDTELQANVTHPQRRAELEQWLEEITALSPDDVAHSVLAALDVPRHVSVSEITIVPTAQAAPV